MQKQKFSLEFNFSAGVVVCQSYCIGFIVLRQFHILPFRWFYGDSCF